MSKKQQAIGVDFGGTSVKLAVVEGAELVSDVHRIPTQDFKDSESLIERIVVEIDVLKSAFPSVEAIGFGVPGSVDFAAGVTYHLTNVQGWAEVPLRDIMTEKTGLPVVVENDANCMCFAEWKYGAAEGFEHVICVTLGTGVGGGLILNGDLYRGSQYAAGEIGQMSIDYQGVTGPYNNTGALERYIGNRQITEWAGRLYDEAGVARPDDISPESIAKLAQGGDPIAGQLWKNVASCLGSCLMSTVFLLNPDAIVIGGGVSYAGNILFEPLREYLEKSLPAECFAHLAIKHARFGNTAGIIGSSALALSISKS